MSTHWSAARAAQRLGVSRATLYAYVSRGAIRSRAIAGRRAREYACEDIERLLAEARGRRDPRGAAQHALEPDGLPVLCSALCLIDGGELYYRGQPAVDLSRRACFEEVATLLWGGPCTWPEPLPHPNASTRRALAKLDFASAGVAHLASVQRADAGKSSLEPARVRETGARIVVELTALACGFRAGSGGVASRLGDAFGVARRGARRALEAALILCADHELNASAFAARVIAGTSATPYMAVIGALGALSGQRHGGVAGQVVGLLEDARPPSEIVADRLGRGEVIPGFGHPLYPDGDPRAAHLLALCPRGAEQRRAAEFVETVERALGLRPNVDFGLVALSRSLALPRHAPFILFALGRTAGWVGHTLEQYEAGTMIRPRARYVGAAPTGSGQR